jgi:hypothetical protein
MPYGKSMLYSVNRQRCRFAKSAPFIDVNSDQCEERYRLVTGALQMIDRQMRELTQLKRAAVGASASPVVPKRPIIPCPKTVGRDALGQICELDLDHTPVIWIKGARFENHCAPFRMPLATCGQIAPGARF